MSDGRTLRSEKTRTSRGRDKASRVPLARPKFRLRRCRSRGPPPGRRRLPLSLAARRAPGSVPTPAETSRCLSMVVTVLQYSTLALRWRTAVARDPAREGSLSRSALARRAHTSRRSEWAGGPRGAADSAAQLLNPGSPQLAIARRALHHARVRAGSNEEASSARANARGGVGRRMFSGCECS